MNRIFMAVVAVGIVVGGIDRIRGNKWGYGAKFEEGFLLLGPMALSMAGMLGLTPLLAKFLGQTCAPLYRIIGADPGMLGSLLAIDLGGYDLAGALAQNPQIGGYAGIIVSSMFGCTVMFTIPMGMGMVGKEDRPLFARGVIYGIVAMPVGLFVGGMLAGLSAAACVLQNAPVLLMSLLLLVGLKWMPEGMIRGFCAFAQGIRWVVTMGLVLGAVEYLCGISLIKGLAPLAETMEVVCSIGIVLLGTLPAAEFLRRILDKPFRMFGKWIGISPEGMSGLMVTMVSVMVTIAMYRNLDEKGKVANAAFMVCAASMLGAHAGYTLSREPALFGPMVCARLGAGAAAFMLAVWLEMRKGEA